jgi:CRISPR system Cascade subunit CasA
MPHYNLLLESWIPVESQDQTAHISLAQLLCQENDWRVCLNRDDMEMATLQLLISMVQIVFMPKDDDDLRDAFDAPLSLADYETAIEPYLDWFDLLHPDYPFMQRNDVKKDSKIKSIHALMAGLPEQTSSSASSHKFFNEINEVTQLDLPTAAIALFNRAQNTPSEGGGFKGGLRGHAPMNTLILGETLRQTLWSNVLSQAYISEHYPQFEAHIVDDVPTWVRPITPKSKFYSHEIGFRRGLMWQSAKLKLKVENDKAIGVITERMGYTLSDEPQKRWLHPHSPYKWEKDKKTTYLSFSSTAPAWTHLTHILIKKNEEKQGNIPALVVSQYREVFRKPSLQLMVGGYRNKQAKIEQRRHELFCFTKGYNNTAVAISNCVTTGLDFKKELSRKLYGLAKQVSGEHGLMGLSNQSQTLFYQRSEPLIHALFRPKDWNETIFDTQLTELKTKLSKLCLDIYDGLVEPYAHDPKLLKNIITQRANLQKTLKKLRETP